jgi:hypothetical protein
MEITLFNEVRQALESAGLRLAGDRPQLAVELLSTGECLAKASCPQAQRMALEVLIGNGRWKVAAAFGGVLLISST